MSDDQHPEPSGSNARDDDARRWVYPADQEFDLVTGTGAHLRMRPIRPADARRLVDFHAKLSSRSVYRRYFSFHPVLSDEEVAHLTQVDYVDRFGFVVLDDARFVGVGRYDRIPGTDEAEVAFVVLDDFQQQGIGLSLLEHLAIVASQYGIRTFTAETQADNRGMMGVFEDYSDQVSARYEDEFILVSFPVVGSRAGDGPRGVSSREATRPGAGPPVGGALC
ncbi:MAG: GNAT family N-acetyltransferase [Acidimicrobiales bacterium]